MGGGLTGLEFATEVAEARPDLDITLATRAELGDWLSPKGRAHLRHVIDRLGITVYENAAVTAVEADQVTTADGRTLPAAVTVWTTGFAVHPLAAATSLELADTGRIVVDATMRSVSHPDVYAIGDSGHALGAADKPLRMSCASGTPMAWQAADSIAARLTGGKLPNAPLRYFNQCISRPQGGPDPVRHRRRPLRGPRPDRPPRGPLQGAGLQGCGLERRQPDDGYSGTAATGGGRTGRVEGGGAGVSVMSAR